MNEALSRREIEDVLSSIRKLVSHAPERPDGAASGHDRAAPAADKASGTLVLTSALRVAEAPVTALDDLPRSSDMVAAQKTQNSDATGQDSGGADQQPPAPLPSTEDGGAFADPVPGGANMRAAPEAVRSTAYPGSDAAPLQADSADAPPQQQSSVPEMPAPASADSPVAGAPGSDDMLEATLARLERALSAPLQAGQGSGAPVAAASGGTEADQGGDARAPGTGDDPVIDEAMLYQIVAHIVRQELQGELGEKITRNIRKLVRAEVARELHLRNL